MHWPNFNPAGAVATVVGALADRDTAIPTPKAGQTYVATDAPVKQVHDGSAWNRLKDVGGGVVAPPALADGWSDITYATEKGNGSVSDVGGMLEFSAAPLGFAYASGWAGKDMAVAGPVDVIVEFDADAYLLSTGLYEVIAIRLDDVANGKGWAFAWGYGGFRSQMYNIDAGGTLAHAGAHWGNVAGDGYQAPRRLRVIDDGTNVRAYASFGAQAPASLAQWTRIYNHTRSEAGGGGGSDALYSGDPSRVALGCFGYGEGGGNQNPMTARVTDITITEG